MNNEYIDYTAATARVYHKQLDWGNKVLMVTPAGDALYQYRMNEDPTPLAFFVVLIDGKKMYMSDPDDGSTYIYVPYEDFFKFDKPIYLDILASKYYCINPVFISWMYEVMKMVDCIAELHSAKLIELAGIDLCNKFFEIRGLDLLYTMKPAAEYVRSYEALRDFHNGITWRNAMIPSDRRFIHDIAQGKYGSDTKVFIQALAEMITDTLSHPPVDTYAITRKDKKDLTYWLTQLAARIKKFKEQE